MLSKKTLKIKIQKQQSEVESNKQGNSPPKIKKLGGLKKLGAPQNKENPQIKEKLEPRSSIDSSQQIQQQQPEQQPQQQQPQPRSSKEIILKPKYQQNNKVQKIDPKEDEDPDQFERDDKEEEEQKDLKIQQSSQSSQIQSQFSFDFFSQSPQKQQPQNYNENLNQNLQNIAQPDGFGNGFNFTFHQKPQKDTNQLSNQLVDADIIRGKSNVSDNLNEDRQIEDSRNNENEQNHEQVIEQIRDCILKSKLQQAESLIQDKIKYHKAFLKDHKSQEDQNGVKKKIRQLVAYRFSNQISEKIADLKKILLQYQSEDSKVMEIQSVIASYSNALILLQVDENLKKAFMQFAINYNLKIKNFDAAKIILKTYRDQIQNLDQKEQEKLLEIEAYCSKYQQSTNSYLGVQCPSCNKNLAFGLATPQCHSCSAKIQICYLSFQPILSEQCVKCNVCLAKYNKKLFESNTLCPYCTLSKINL